MILTIVKASYWGIGPVYCFIYGGLIGISGSNKRFVGKMNKKQGDFFTEIRFLFLCLFGKIIRKRMC